MGELFFEAEELMKLDSHEAIEPSVCTDDCEPDLSRVQHGAIGDSEKTSFSNLTSDETDDDDA